MCLVYVLVEVCRSPSCSPPPAAEAPVQKPTRDNSSPCPASPASPPISSYSIAALLGAPIKREVQPSWPTVQHSLYGLSQLSSGHPLQSARDFLRGECHTHGDTHTIPRLALPLPATVCTSAAPSSITSMAAFYNHQPLSRPADGLLSPAPSSSSSDSGSVSPMRDQMMEVDKPRFPWDLDSKVPVDFSSPPTIRRNEPPRFNCDGCGKSYATFSGLSKHKRFHCTSEIKKEFSCKYCEKKYSSLGALKMHIRTHTLPCKCPLCGKAFSRPWLLQGHIRTHTGEKPFNCQHCSRAFADRSNLRAHLQTHTDFKKYNCNACTKTFSRMSLLHKHEESCTGKQEQSL